MKRNTMTTVASGDGTRVATEISGSGPPIILVSQALSDHTHGRRLAAALAPSFTVYNYDRRGRGDTRLAGAWSLEGEIDDIAALASHAGGRANLFGSSSGAALALRTADRLGDMVNRLVLFEPPFIVDDSRPPLGSAFRREIEERLACADNAGAVRTFFRGLGMPALMVAAMRLFPGWSAMVRLAPTLPTDLAVLEETQRGQPLPPELGAGVTAPTLVVTGAKSEPFFASGAHALANQIDGPPTR